MNTSRQEKHVNRGSRLLRAERDTLEKYLPGLDHALAAIPLSEMERAGSPAIEIFREHRGSGLLVPSEHGGLGAAALDALRIQRAIASRSPSLAIATTMHHFSVASIVELVKADQSKSNFAWILLEAVAKQNLYVASGFAEGQSGQSIIAPKMRASRAKQGLIVNGSKKPCSLSASMDLLTASVAVESDSGNGAERAVVVIPANAPGLERRTFWAGPILAGAQSDEIVIRDVFVPSKLVAPLGNIAQMSPMENRAFLWFELLISGSYLGIATALVEKAIGSGKGGSAERVALVIEIEGAMAALERTAQLIAESNASSDEQLAHSLFTRFAVQGAIERSTARSAEICGGMSFATSFDVPYLYAAARALAFHPPSRLSSAPMLDSYLTGAPLSAI
jgi:alkylation response protein AidB-like acyl-CoA dehydrogenase